MLRSRTVSFSPRACFAIRPALALVLAGLAACAQPYGSGDGSGGPGSGAPTGTPGGATPDGGTTGAGTTGAGGAGTASAAKLADRDVKTETRGAWARRTAIATSRGPGGGELRRHEAKAELAMDASESAGWSGGPAAAAAGADGGGPATGAAMPPGAPAPAPSLSSGDTPKKARGLARSDDPFGGERLNPSIARQSGPMRAGSTDDNADFGPFLDFLAQRTADASLRDRFQPMDVRDRRFVRVVDAKGRPVPAARVTVLDEAADRLVGEGTTYGDGRVPVYPRLGANGGALPGPVVAEARLGAATVRGRFDFASGEEFTLTLAGDVPPPDPVPLDVTFLIDTTGSMGDEIASIQDCLLRVTEKIRGLARESDLRYATVLYRDVDDEYLTATHPFSADIDSFAKALRDVSAAGGGDGPESLNQGLSEAVNGLAWRDGAAKVVFLIADAPPHMDYAGDTPYGDTCVRAVAKGIRVHTVAASGLDAAGTLVFRQIAQATRGKFVFVEYGVPGSGEDAKRHGVAGAVKNDNLEDVIFGQIRDEVARWGR